MRTLAEIRPELKKIVNTYKRCQRGNDVVRFVLSNSFDIFWLLLEINTIIENDYE